MSRRRPLYVETLIRAEAEDLWRATQDPGQHQRWDLRFTQITYLSPPADDGRQRFRYSVSLLPGLRVAGTGVHAGERLKPDGTRTSVLRFESGQLLSLIRSGTGYWRYVPTPAGIRFLTGYDYRPGWGRLGEVADRLFRPAMGWATAWSFDRLRIWLEDGIPPERSLRRWALDAALRVVVCAAAGLITPAPVAAAATLAVICLPARRSVPSARRCLRRPSDRLSATYPAEPPPLASSRSGRLAVAAPGRTAPGATCAAAAARTAPGATCAAARPRLRLVSPSAPEQS